MRERTGRTKVRKTHGFGKRQFNGESKAVHARGEKPRNSFTASHQKSGAQPSLGKQSSIMPDSDLVRQTSPTSFCHQFYMLRMTSHGMGHPFVWLGSAVQLWPLPTLCASPAYLPAGQCEKQKRPCCANTT